MAAANDINSDEVQLSDGSKPPSSGPTISPSSFGDIPPNADKSTAITISERTSTVNVVNHRVRAQLPRYIGLHSTQALPNTHGGIHPACVLLHQRSLACSAVCDERLTLVAEAQKEVQSLPIEETLDTHDLDGSGDYGMRETQKVLGSNLDFLQEKVPDTVKVLLVAFVDLKHDMTVGYKDEAADKIRFVLVLWRIYQAKRSYWQSGPGQLKSSHGVREILDIMRSMNNRMKVSEREARWVLDKVESLECRTEEEELLALNFCMAFWYMQDSEECREDTLIRRTLMQRLELESAFSYGLARLCHLGILFCILTACLTYQGSYRSERRGIHQNLESKFELNTLSDITSVTDLHGYIKKFSQISVALSPLSHSYFSSQAWVLQHEPKTFLEPELQPSLDMHFTKAMTFQAWISLAASSATMEPKPIFRKALGNLDLEMQHSCWSWNFPPSLSYGAHDYGGTMTNPETGLSEEFVGPNYSVPVQDGMPQFPELGSMVLHTLTVNETHATFMLNDGQIIGDAIPLPRPVTDCISQEVTLGSKGLTLAAVRYYPRQLTKAEVQEIYRGGNILSSVSYMMPSLDVEPVRIDDLLLRDVRMQGEHQSDQFEKAAASLQTASVLTTRAILSPGERPQPLHAPNHSITYESSDPTIGHEFWQIYGNETYTDASSKNLAPGNALPEAGVNGGMTISTWLKFDTAVGHGYHIARAMPRYGEDGEPSWDGVGNACWMLYAGADYTAIYTKSGNLDGNGKLQDGPFLQVLDKKAPEGWRFSGKSYRHLVYQIDPSNTTAPLKICIDGACTGSSPAMNDYSNREKELHNFPPSADCGQTGLLKDASQELREKALNASLIYLNRRPIDDWPMTTWQMSTKYFNRVLSDYEIQELFEKDPNPSDPDQAPMRKTRGCSKPGEVEDDRTFRDDFGNDCFWYFNSHRKDANVCKRSPEAMLSCPMACQASETCWGSKLFGADSASMPIWPLQMEFRSKGRWGTTCLGKSTTPEREAISCALNAPNWTNVAARCEEEGIKNCGPRDCSRFEFDRAALLGCLGDTQWVPEKSTTRSDIFMPCRDIILLHEPTCDWDDSWLDDFASDANSNGAWSLNFWVESLSSEGCLQPQMRLIGGDGGTFSLLGGVEKFTPDDAVLGAGCNQEEWLAHMLVGKKSDGYRILPEADLAAPKAVSGRKHFTLFGRKSNGWAGLHYDSLHTEENVFSNTDGPQPIPTDKSFLRVINVLGDIRLSPLQLRSDYPSTAAIVLMEYEQFLFQSLRRGPTHPLAMQLNHKIERSVDPFTEKVMLAAPPLLTQMRSMQQDCDAHFENNYAKVVMEWGQRYQCSDPYSCSGYDLSKVYRCAGDQETGSYFGMLPEVIDGEQQYVEYLATIADNELVMRPIRRGSDDPPAEQLLQTDDFIDVLTSRASISAIFYSNDYGILSLLQITFQTQEGRVSASYAVHHLAEASRNLESFSAGMILCILLTLAWLVCSTRSLRATFRGLRSKALGRSLTEWTMEGIRQRFNSHTFVVPPWWSVGEMLFAAAFLVLLVTTLVDRQTVSGRVDDLIGRLISIDWESQSASFGEKKTAYVKVFADIMDHIWGDSVLVNVTLVAVLALLSVVVSFTSCHPRIALITRTLKVALSDMVHFALLFAVVFLGFAIIGTWRFGSRRQDMRSVSATCRVQFDAMLGPPGDLFLASQNEEGDAWEYLIYAAAFHSVCFFFLLNFCLAIIIDSYSKVIEEVRENVTEQDIFSDLYYLCVKKWLAWRHCWPSEANLVEHLENELNSRYVTTDMLYWAGEEEGPGFKTMEDADTFMEFYRQLSFLTDTEDVVHETPTVEDVATFQCLTLQKLEQLIRTVKRHHNGLATLPNLLSPADRMSKV